MRVAVVGNAPPKKDFGKAIDSADVVIRFNRLYNLDTGLVGSKFDIWCLCTHGAPVVDFVKPHVSKLLPKVKGISEILFGSPADIVIPGTGGMREEGKRIRDNLEWEGPWSNVPVKFYKELRKSIWEAHMNVRREDIGDEFIPSTGLVGIQWAMSIPRFKGWDVDVFGFDFFRGWSRSCHPSTAERLYVEHLAKAGRITYNDPGGA